METTANEREDLTFREVTYQCKTDYTNCRVGSDNSIKAGANIKFSQRSKKINNPKDEYGFRAMSPFTATEHFVREPVGESIALTKPRGNPLQSGWIRETMSGYPRGVPYWHRAITERMSIPLEQSGELLIMRAEQGLAQEEINLLQFAAFLPATMKSITKALREMDSLLDILHDVKKLKRRFRGTDLRSLYLQWLFVWNQLVRDILGGINFLKKQSRPIGSLVTGRSRALSTMTFQDVARPYAWTAIGDSVCDSTITVEQRAVSVARVTCDLAYSYNSLGLDNPLYLAWDLLRWSWVVDQVFDIGLFIGSLTSTHGLQFLGTSYTERTTNECIVTVHPFKTQTQWREKSYNPNYAPGISRRKRVSRIVRSNPTRNVTLRNPFKNSIAVTAAVAAAVSMKMGGKDISKISRIARP